MTFGAGQFSLEVDAYYSQRKFDFEEGDIVDTLNYFELPILARFRLLSKETWNLSAVGGAALSFLLNAKETISGTEFDIKSAVKSNETAGVVGAQVGIGRWRGGRRPVSDRADGCVHRRGFSGRRAADFRLPAGFGW